MKFLLGLIIFIWLLPFLHGAEFQEERTQQQLKPWERNYQQSSEDEGVRLNKCIAERRFILKENTFNKYHTEETSEARIARWCINQLLGRQPAKQIKLDQSGSRADFTKYIAPVFYVSLIVISVLTMVLILRRIYRYLLTKRHEVAAFSNATKVFIFAAGFAIPMLLFPPFDKLSRNGQVIDTEYHFFKLGYRGGVRMGKSGYEIAWGQLLIQCLILAIVTGLALHLVLEFKKRGKRRD